MPLSARASWPRSPHDADPADTTVRVRTPPGRAERDGLDNRRRRQRAGRAVQLRQLRRRAKRDHPQCPGRAGAEGGPRLHRDCGPAGARGRPARHSHDYRACAPSPSATGETHCGYASARWWARRSRSWPIRPWGKSVPARPSWYRPDRCPQEQRQSTWRAARDSPSATVCSSPTRIRRRRHGGQHASPSTPSPVEPLRQRDDRAAPVARQHPGRQRPPSTSRERRCSTRGRWSSSTTAPHKEQFTVDSRVGQLVTLSGNITQRLLRGPPVPRHRSRGAGALRAEQRIEAEEELPEPPSDRRRQLELHRYSRSHALDAHRPRRLAGILRQYPERLSMSSTRQRRRPSLYISLENGDDGYGQLTVDDFVGVDGGSGSAHRHPGARGHRRDQHLRRVPGMWSRTVQTALIQPLRAAQGPLRHPRPAATACRIEGIRDVPRATRHQVRRALLPVGRGPRPVGPAQRRRRRRPATWPASTPASTSSAACTRRRPTR